MTDRKLSDVIRERAAILLQCGVRSQSQALDLIAERVAEMERELAARLALDAWLSEHEIGYQVDEHYGRLRFGVFIGGNIRWADRDWYDSFSDLADALGLEWRDD